MRHLVISSCVAALAICGMSAVPPAFQHTETRAEAQFAPGRSALARDQRRRRAAPPQITSITEADAGDYVTIAAANALAESIINEQMSRGEYWTLNRELSSGDLTNAPEGLAVFKRWDVSEQLAHYTIHYTAGRSAPKSPAPIGYLQTSIYADASGNAGGAMYNNTAYVEKIEGDPKVLRERAVVRLREDGRMAVRYLYQDHDRKWHEIATYIYDDFGETYDGECGTCGRVIADEPLIEPFQAQPPAAHVSSSAPPRRVRRFARTSVMNESDTIMSREDLFTVLSEM